METMNKSDSLKPKIIKLVERLEYEEKNKVYIIVEATAHYDFDKNKVSPPQFDTLKVFNKRIDAQLEVDKMIKLKDPYSESCEKTDYVEWDRCGDEDKWLKYDDEDMDYKYISCITIVERTII
jgi:hypothetical protein